MNKWLHLLGSVALSAIGVTPQGMHAASGHPVATVIGLAAWGIVGNLLPPPFNVLVKLFTKA